MSIFRFILGLVEVELSSAALESTFAVFNHADMELAGVHRINELTCRFWIKRQDEAEIRRMCEKRGDNLRILRRLGLYREIQSVCRRRVLLAGIVILLAITLCLPSRILFVQVNGNEMISTNQILSAAEHCGICFGASRKTVRSEQVKNTLLSALPQLQWAGVNTSGCVATISVRERAKENVSERVPQVSSIVADRDGYIQFTTVTKGNLLVQPGQTVKEGQTLVSGYTDCGISIQATRAQGEILAQTNRNVEAVTLAEYIKRGHIGDVKRKISFLYRKKRINLWKDSGISDSSCGRIYKEYYITLPGGLQLPIALCIEAYTVYESDKEILSQDAAQSALTKFAYEYLRQQMIAGQILQGDQAVALVDGAYRLKGQYTCLEMIGRERQEEIGDTNGKNS